jgi:hypothetical protein
MLTICNHGSLPSDSRKPLKLSYVLPMALSSKAVLSTSCISDAVSTGLKQNLLQMCCSFKSAIRKQQITLYTHNNKIMRKVMAAKLNRLNEKTAMI